MSNLDLLQQQFSDAIKTAEAEKIHHVLTDFDQLCRLLVEQEHDEVKKKTIINNCLQVQKDWQSQIIKLKAKVKADLADIKSNGKKIQKYLTSY